MGNVISFINTYTQDYFEYGVVSKCPNCDNRTIISYPTTKCGKCQNRFKNDITAVDVYTYIGYYGYRERVTKYGKRSVASQLLSSKVASLLRSEENFGKKSDTLLTTNSSSVDNSSL
jgi:hypothetical protein